MERADPLRIADILKTSPMWARLALTASNEALVDRGADAMASLITRRLEEPEPTSRHPDQLALPGTL